MKIFLKALSSSAGAPKASTGARRVASSEPAIFDSPPLITSMILSKVNGVVSCPE